jgi:DNA-binding IclR family transcriptional regulator
VTTAAGGRPSPDTVLGKAMLVLTSFGSDDRGLTFTDLATRTGLPKSTLHRTCTSMVREGLLVRDGDRYHASRLVFELGMRASLERELIELALPYLEDLRVAVDETVHLGVREADEVVYVAKLAGRRGVEAPSRTGGRLGLHCTAVGKVLLAHAPADVQRAVLEGELERRTPRTVTAPGLVAAQLEKVRADGVAFEHEESRLGVVCVAAPVRGAAEEVVAAVSIAGPVTRFHPARHAPQVSATAVDLSRALAARSRFR